MIKELIKLADDLDKAGQPNVANKVDQLISSLETDEHKIAKKIADKVNEMKLTEGRARRGATGFGMGSKAILIGYLGSQDGIPGNAGDTTAKSRAAVESAIKSLGMEETVSVTEVEQDQISGYGSVIDSDPPPSHVKPASYQIDIVYLTIK